MQLLRSGPGSNSHEVAVDLTTELRWFFDGGIPNDVLSWFTCGGTTGSIEERCDTYRLDGQVDIGVKRRFRTVLELKLRQGAPEPFSFGWDSEGWLEIWRRWSPAEGRVSLTDDTTWLDVDKTVIKRRFDDEGSELPFSEATRAMTGQGCDAEIASVSLGHRTSWTFAFAAFGPVDDHRPSLELAWDALVSVRPWPRQLRLERADSCGYPGWIARLPFPAE